MRGFSEKAKADVYASIIISFVFSLYATLSLVGYGLDGFTFFLFFFSLSFLLNNVVISLYHLGILTYRSFVYMFVASIVSAMFAVYSPNEVSLFLIVFSEVVFFLLAMIIAEGRGYYARS